MCVCVFHMLVHWTIYTKFITTNTLPRPVTLLDIGYWFCTIGSIFEHFYYEVSAPEMTAEFKGMLSRCLEVNNGADISNNNN